RGYTGTWPYCQPCGECFHQWDDIIQGLKSKVENLINTANNIEDTGVASAYDEEFENMEKVLEDTKKKLSDANVSKEHIEELDNEVAKLKKEVADARERLDGIEARVSNATQSVDFAQEDLKQLQLDADRLTEAASDLHEKTNKIKEADVQGAYNITRESASRSLAAQRRTDAAIGKLAEAESPGVCGFCGGQSCLAGAVSKADQARSFSLEADLKLNEKQKEAEEVVIESPGVCGFCGGQSCLAGAVSKADQARSFSLEADLKLNEKQKEAEEVLTLVRDVLHSTAAAKKDAQEALEVARAAAQKTNSSRAELDQIVDQMNNFLKSSRSSPEQIRTLAEEVLSKKISLTPEQIAALTSKIRDSLAKISNIGAILAETRGNKTLASNLESKALEASARAAAIKNTTDTVREAIQVAEEAQLAASEAIRSADEVMKQAKYRLLEHLEAAKKEANATESRAKEVNASLSTLEGEMKKVKVQYLQIADDAKNAFQLVDKALQAAQTAEQGNKQMTMDIETAQGLLSSRTQGNEAPQKRAEALRQR
ncbi:unnamed protein product, partial [Cylicostephanus goldi]